MALCIFSKEDSDNGFVTLSNSFITNYMKECNEEQLKVYLLGLYLCSNPMSRDNTIEHMEAALNLSTDSIVSAFAYWQELGLITIFNYDPLQIQYLSSKNKLHLKTYKKEKYSDFNVQLETLFPNKAVINPNTYTMFYDFIDKSNISPNVFIMIARYCVNLKGANISSNYILTVATNWINDGVRTIDAVEQRIKQYELNSDALRQICTAISKSTPLTPEDKDLYIKWTQTWGFEINGILTACKKSYKSLNKLDLVLEDCFKNNAIGVIEIDAFLKNKKKLLDYAIRISNLIGVWYDNSAPIVENYISPWINKGYDIDTLEIIAKYCLKNSIRKYEQVDRIVNNLYADGIITNEKVSSYFNTLDNEEIIIKDLLVKSGSSRNVSAQDRDLYRVWTRDWELPLELIQYSATLCLGKPFSELAKKLITFKDNNVSTIKMAKEFELSKSSTKDKKRIFNSTDKDMSSEELEALASNDEDIIGQWKK